jgi:hypothetical protein
MAKDKGKAVDRTYDKNDDGDNHHAKDVADAFKKINKKKRKRHDRKSRSRRKRSRRDSGSDSDSESDSESDSDNSSDDELRMLRSTCFMFFFSSTHAVL